HVNYVAQGSKLPSRDGELPSNHVSHYTLEPHIGLTPWLEAGAYFQTALRPDNQFDYAGVKLRTKGRLPFRPAGFGFALNVEVSSVPKIYEAARIGSEFRPVIDFRSGRLYLSVNPIVSVDFDGPWAGHPQLQPAAKLAVELIGGLAIGCEYYAALGPV